MKKTIVTPYKKIDELLNVAGELAYLADAYAGGESETAKALSNKLDKLQSYFTKLQEKQAKPCCH